MDERILPGLLTLTIIAVVFALMFWGWRGRLKRQGTVGELPEVPQGLGEPVMSVPGQYVVTTASGDWLDRLAVHGLGVRTPAVVSIYAQAVVIERRGAQDLFIAQDALTEITTQAGMAGKFVERDGLVVIAWRLGETSVDTGFRTTDAGAKRPLLEALQALLPQGSGTDSNGKNN